MLIAADTHVHLYPGYRVDHALLQLSANLRRAVPEASVLIGCLTERHDCDVFRSLHEGTAGAACCEPAGEAALRCVAGPDVAVYLLAGRQMVARERIEVLGLAMEARIADGAPAADLVQAVLDRGGVPVIPWSPGKWFGARGRVVEALVERFGAGRLLLGDTTLRPRGWGEPCVMRAASRDGLAIVAGSDPLPFAGEERQAGRYATRLEGDFDPGRPAESFRRLAFEARAPEFRRMGRRNDPLTWARRMVTNARR